MAVSSKNVIMSMVDPLEEVNRERILAITAQSMVGFCSSLFNHGISLVWCWDGKSVPDKDATKEERKQAKNLLRDRIAAKRAELESVHPLARTPQMITELKMLMCNHNVISWDEMEYLKEMIGNLGFASVVAESEGEKLASALAIEGKIAGVWSEDTDNYALGTPITITGFNGYSETGEQLVSIVPLPSILQALSADAGRQITHPEFVDLCIMCGTDFNKNMPNVGHTRAWALIKKYGSIDAIAASEPQRPIQILNHHRTREIFAYALSPFHNATYELDFDLNKYIASRDFALYYGLETIYPTFTSAVDMYLRYIGKPCDVITSPNISNISPPSAASHPPEEDLKTQIASVRALTNAPKKSRFVIV